MAFTKASGGDKDPITNTQIAAILKSIEVQITKHSPEEGKKLDKLVHGWNDKPTVKDYNKVVEEANKALVKVNNMLTQAAAKAKTEAQLTAQDEGDTDGGWKLTGTTTPPTAMTESAKGVWAKFVSGVQKGKHPKNAAKAAGDTQYKSFGSSTQYQIRLSGSERATFTIDKKKKECHVLEVGGHT